MKRTLGIFLVFLCIPFSLFAEFEMAYDINVISSFFVPSLYSSAEVGYIFNGNTRLSLSLAYSKSYESDLASLDYALLFSFFPIENEGFVLGASLIRAGFMFGLDSPYQDNTYFLGSGFLGWSFRFPHFFIEPRFVFSNSLGRDEKALETLKKNIKQYFQYSLSLLIGVRI